jgi:hypothetical protein
VLYQCFEELDASIFRIEEGEGSGFLWNIGT